MVNYCLPIIKNTKEEVLKEIDDNRNTYQFFEVWVDYVKGLNNQFINDLSKDLDKRLIFVFRRQNLENTKLDHKKRLDIINQLENTSVVIDLDVISQKSELQFIKQNNLKNKVVVSYHNYDLTPDNEDLIKLTDEMKLFKPYIYKVACFCKNDEDPLRLLQLLLNLKKQKLKFIVLGMGEKGVMTRIFGSLLGNELIFAPTNNSEPSAPDN